MAHTRDGWHIAGDVGDVQRWGGALDCLRRIDEVIADNRGEYHNVFSHPLYFWNKNKAINMIDAFQYYVRKENKDTPPQSPAKKFQKSEKLVITQ